MPKSEHSSFHHKNKIVSEETKNRMCKSHIDKYILKETKNKISEKLKGKNHPLFGKHHSEEVKKKISNNNPNKLTNQKIINIQSDIKKGDLTYKEMAKKHKVCPATICKINKFMINK